MAEDFEDTKEVLVVCKQIFAKQRIQSGHNVVRSVLKSRPHLLFKKTHDSFCRFEKNSVHYRAHVCLNVKVNCLARYVGWHVRSHASLIVVPECGFEHTSNVT